MKKLLAGLLFMALCGCSHNVEDIKRNSTQVWNKNGFEVVGYEGYQSGAFETFGGCVWYIVQRDNTLYHGCISKWGSEYHIYNLTAMNALKSN